MNIQDPPCTHQVWPSNSVLPSEGNLGSTTRKCQKPYRKIQEHTVCWWPQKGVPISHTACLWSPEDFCHYHIGLEAFMLAFIHFYVCDQIGRLHPPLSPVAAVFYHQDLASLHPSIIPIVLEQTTCGLYTAWVNGIDNQDCGQQAGVGNFQCKEMQKHDMLPSRTVHTRGGRLAPPPCSSIGSITLTHTIATPVITSK